MFVFSGSFLLSLSCPVLSVSYASSWWNKVYIQKT